MKFTKRPVTVEAFQLTEEFFTSNVSVSEAFNTIKIVYNQKEKNAIIYTLEGNMLARLNDWIIRGVHGEFYPCKPDIFEKTYAPVTLGNPEVKPQTLLTRGQVCFQHYGDNMMFRLHVEAKDLKDAMHIYEQVKGKIGKVFFEEA